DRSSRLIRLQDLPRLGQPGRPLVDTPFRPPRQVRLLPRTVRSPHTRRGNGGLMEPITVEMTIDKTTKNTYRFSENSDEPVMSTIYLQKSAFEGLPPKTITVTVEESD